MTGGLLGDGAEESRWSRLIGPFAWLGPSHRAVGGVGKSPSRAGSEASRNPSHGAADGGQARGKVRKIFHLESSLVFFIHLPSWNSLQCSKGESGEVMGFYAEIAFGLGLFSRGR